MTSKIRVSNSIIAFSILGLAMAVPSFAQTTAGLKFSDLAGDLAVLTPTGTGTTGTVTITGPCVGLGTCPAGTATFTPGTISWSGYFGNFYISTITGQTKPSTTGGPQIDLGAGQVALINNNNDTLTVTWSDTGFTGGANSSSVSNTVFQVSAGSTFSLTSYVDNGNALYGMGSTAIPTQTFSTMTVGSVVANGTGSTAANFSMTEVAVYALTNGGSANNDSEFSVSTAPLGLVCPASTATAGTAYTGSLTATGGVPPYVYSILSGSISPLVLNPSSGAITGTPSAQGTLNFVGQVVDSSGSTASTLTANCTITVNPPSQTGGNTPPSLSVACPATTTGQVGVAYHGSLTEMGGTAPFSFSTSGSGNNNTGLPPGLSISVTGKSSGAISGTPTQAGTFTFTGKVTDSSKPVLTATTTANGCNITIAPAPPKLSFVCPTGTGSIGTAYSSKIVASGGVAPYKFYATSLPPGLQLTTASGLYGVISGTPTSSGSFQIHVTVTDASGTSVGNTCSSDCTIVIGCSTTSGSGSISGYVYDDLNGSKTYNNGDKAFQGVTVTLKASNGSTVTATSNSSGYYSFSNLPAGNYTVSAPTSAVGNETLDTPSSISVTVGGGNSYSCTSTSTNNNFGYVGSSTVTGKCYTNDWWGNSHGCGGQTITVSGKDCYGNNVKKTCNTDSNGNYSCSGLYPGSYTINAPTSCNLSDGYHSIQTSNNINVGCQSNDYHSNLNFCYNYGW